MTNKWYINPVMRSMKRKMRNQIDKAVEVVKSTAIQTVAVDTGNTKGSFTDDVREQGDEIIGRIGNTSEAAPHLEFGTGEFAEGGKGRKGGWVYKHPKFGFLFTLGMKPQPFLRPALINNEKRIFKILKDF